MINLLWGNIGSRGTKRDSAIRRGFSAPLRYALQRSPSDETTGLFPPSSRLKQSVVEGSCITERNLAMRRDFSPSVPARAGASLIA
jgi:hypothetical protein